MFALELQERLQAAAAPAISLARPPGLARTNLPAGVSWPPTGSKLGAWPTG